VLDSVFVPFTPFGEGPSKRDLSLSDSWKPFINAFNTWMEQAQSKVRLDKGVYASRIGNVVFVTGKVVKGSRIAIPKPAVGYSVGSVLFSEEGLIVNDGEDVAISTSYVAKE